MGQTWRGRGPHHALLSAALAGIDVRALDDATGRAAGELLALARRASAAGGARKTSRSDVVDAALVLLADDGDHIVTSDLDDIELLAAAAGCHVELVRA